MKTNDSNYKLLKSSGFELIEENTSVYFDDYYGVFSNRSFQLRFGRSKSFESIDISKNIPNENWYDLALVKALLFNETELNKVTPFEEYSFFIQNNLTRISNLFNDMNYPDTKKKLEELGNRRAEQMMLNPK